jgi:hypothetical protein
MFTRVKLLLNVWRLGPLVAGLILSPANLNSSAESSLIVMIGDLSIIRIFVLPGLTDAIGVTGASTILTISVGGIWYSNASWEYMPGEIIAVRAILKMIFLNIAG